MRLSPIQMMIFALLAVSATATAGTIRGVVEAGDGPALKVADRYDGAKAARPMGGIPTVVFLQGPVAGHPADPPAGPAVISQEDLAFHPPLLLVSPGTRVEFPNQDKEFHNVFSYSAAKRFDLGRYPQGESKPVVFDKPGIVKIYCEIHEFMRAAVVVVENPFHAVPAEDGSFVLDGVPPGEYQLVVWNIDRGSRKMAVRVSGGDDPPVTVRLTRQDPAVPVSTLALAAAGPLPEGPGGCCARP